VLVNGIRWSHLGRELFVIDTRRIGGRCLVAGGGSWLAATFVGGGLLGIVEGVGLAEGLWLAFSAASTAGYVAPSTAAGRGIVFFVFVFALAAFVLLLTGSILRARAGAWDRPRTRAADGIRDDDIRRVVASIRMN
jgi:hypothetical protein